MKKSQRNLLLGIDIGSTTIRSVVVSHVEGSRYREVLQTRKTVSDGVRSGNVIDDDALAQKLEEIVTFHVNDHEERISGTMCALGGAHMETRHTHGNTLISRGDGTITSLDIENALKDAEKSLHDAKNKSIVHTIPLRYKLDGQEISGNIIGLRGHKLEIRALFVTYPKQYIESFKRALKKAHIEPLDIVAGPIAEAVAVLSKKQKIAGVGLVHIGAETTSLIVYENNMPLLISAFAVGGNHITKDVALGLKVSLEEAELIKNNEATFMFSRRRADEVIEARIEDIADAINNELEKVKRRELLPAGILLLGDSTKIERIEYTMRNIIKLPVKKIDNEMSIISNGTLIDQSFARAYGLAFLAPHHEDIHVLFTLLQTLFLRAKKFFYQFLP